MSDSSGHNIPPGVIAQAAAVVANPPSTELPSGSAPIEDTSLAEDLPIEEAPPPVFSEAYGLVDVSQDGLNTRANVLSDGRVNININQKTSTLSNLLVPALRSQLKLQHVDEPPTPPPGYIPPSLGGLPGQAPPPPMNIVIHVVGSRGDVQPFVALGQVLKKTYGHRVRLATHPTFRAFIEENGLEFFSIGGDPAELMAFMVKNPGLMPGKDALRSGDIGKRRKEMYEIIKRCWRSCFEAGDGTGIEVSDNQASQTTWSDGNMPTSNDFNRPFVADAIIANPPSFAHIHCAEKLGIPLHLMFTMPWSPTQAFPHPLANIQSSNADVNMTNFISYALVEMMTWQGLGDLINRFREKSLGLEPVSLMWAPGMASRLRIPYTYCWSPALIPKPKDWGSHITVSGFYFLALADNYTPAPDLQEFLSAGPPPVYIGFGSIVVENPDAMTELIFKAVSLTGQRALVSKGWGGFGGDSLVVPEDVFMLGNVPHDWLFKHVSCVVHHGGAGTTAAGIATGRPTVVVPFFGDQPFWGAMVAKAGAGPLPINNKQLTAENLAGAINQALRPETLLKAQALGAKIKSEKGSDLGAQNFHDALQVDKLRCFLAPSRAAVWRVKRTEIRLSAFAAAILGNEGLLDFSELKLYRPREYASEDGPWGPISGGASALIGTVGSLMMGVADFPVEIFKACSNKTTHDKISGEPSSTPESTVTPIRTPTSRSRANSRPPSRLMSTNSLHTAQEGIGSIHSNDTHAGESIFSLASTTADDGSVGSHPSPSAPPSSTNLSTHSSLTSTESPSMSLGTALGTGKGVARIVSAGLKSPMDFTLGLARGFHNAPKLYGDQSVRQPDRITGFQSGLKAAGKEFGFGFYDGISGLVTQPLEGAKKEGVAGLIKGFGKGIGGIVLKPGAAIWGLPGYTFMGIYKEIQKLKGSSVQNYIMAARTAQGYEEWKTSTQEERVDIVGRWHAAQMELGQQKKHGHSHRTHSPHGFHMTKGMSFHDRKQHKKMGQTAEAPTNASGHRPEPSANNTDSNYLLASDSNDRVFEHAIQESVATTSRGNAEEDALIEKAIRASVAELRRSSADGNDEDAIQRAIEASIAESSQARARPFVGDNVGGTQENDTYDEELKRALQLSMQDHVASQREAPASSAPDQDDSGVDTDDDQNIKLALENSKSAATVVPTQGHHEMGTASEQFRARTEEEIVLEYVKKQSLAEEEHRLALLARTRPEPDT